MTNNNAKEVLEIYGELKYYLEARVVCEILAGRCLRKLKHQDKFRFSFGGGADVEWSDFIASPEVDLTNRQDREFRQMAKWLEDNKLTYTDLRGLPNRRRVLWLIAKGDKWRDFLPDALLNSKYKL